MKKQDEKKSIVRTNEITAAALFVALLAVCSWISIPLPGTGVPINLATFAVILAGLMLGEKNGPVAVFIFLLLGAVGLPVFHSFTGGIGILVGPTGGFLVGYLALAFAAGLCRPKNKEDGLKAYKYIAFAVVGELALYALGTLWYMHVALGGISTAKLAAALFACVIPFIPGDAAKIAVAYIVNNRLSKALK